MNSLELLQSTPAEQLHHNLKYIDRNKGTDFVAEALRPDGRSIEKTVEFLYSAEENYDAGKVRDIADFIGGFEGIEKIADEQLSNLDFKEIESARLRDEKVKGFLVRSAAVYCPLISIGIGLTISPVLIDNFASTHMGDIGLLVGSLSYVALTLITLKLRNKLEGNQKPREAYFSLLGKAGKADEFLQIYNIAEKLNYKDEQK